MKKLEKLKLHNLEEICAEDQKCMKGGNDPGPQPGYDCHLEIINGTTMWVMEEVVCVGSSNSSAWSWLGTASINSNGSLQGYYNSPEMQAVIDNASNNSSSIGNTEWEKFQDWNKGQPSGNEDGVCPDPITENLAWQLWQWVRN